MNSGRLAVVISSLSLAAAASCARSSNVVARWPEVEPATVGMSAEGLARVDSILMAAIADSATPGAALAVGRYGRLVRLRGFGHLDWAPGSPPVIAASIYDLASLTKVIGTTTAIMILSEEGRVDLDGPVATYLPWWGAAGKQDVTVRQLLLHRGGLPPFLAFWRDRRGREEFKEAIGELALVYTPGDSTVYSDIGFISLGFIVEAVAGEALDEFLRRRLFEPLGLQDTGFRPDATLLDRIAPTEEDTVYRFTHVHGVVHDENAYALGGVSGHAGLFSSARDLAVIAQLLLNGGVVEPCLEREVGVEAVPGCGRDADRVRIVERETIVQFTARYDSLSTRALGWDTPNGRSSAGSYLSYQAFGHTGFTGTSIWIDPRLDLFVVLLTNRVNPTRANRKHIPLRRAVHDAVAQAISDRVVAERVR